MRLDLDLAPMQRTYQQATMSPSIVYRAWRDNPMNKVDDSEAIKHLSVAGGEDYGSFNPMWKRIRNRILGGMVGRSVNIGIIGNSVSGKSEMAQVLSELVERDVYLQVEARKRNLTIVPVTMPFALAAKAFQIPVEKGGPGLVRIDADHGKFTPEEYETIASGIQSAVEISQEMKVPGMVKVNIMEASGLPFPTWKRDRVTVEGMADRGVSPIYNLAESAQAKSSFIFLMTPNRMVQEFGLTERNFDPKAPNQKELTDGRVVYKLTAPDGTVKDVAELSEEQQAGVAELLSKSMAPKAAVERSNGEFEAMKIQLANEGIIGNTSNESYMKALRDRVLHRSNGARTAIPSEQVVVIESQFWAGFRNPSSNVRNLDYLLRDCLWSQSYDELVPESLRGFLAR